MKKRIVACICLLIMCVLTACGSGSSNNSGEGGGSRAGNEATKIPWNMFSTINDLSYPMWYLSVKEHTVDYNDWNIYEFDMEELWVVLFQSISEEGPSGEYYLFVYDQLGNNPLAYAMIAKASVSPVEADLEGENIYELEFSEIWNPDPDFTLENNALTNFRIRCNDSGLIDRIKLSKRYGFDIAYTASKQIEAVYRGTWDTLNSFATGEVSSDLCMTYQYNGDGTLGKVTGVNTNVYDDQEHTRFEFEYDENHNRTKAIDSFSYSCDYVEYYRNDQLTTNKIVYGDGGHTEYIIEYLEDGTFGVPILNREESS